MKEKMTNFEKNLGYDSQSDKEFHFEPSRDFNSIIKVIGVGGGGSNAVNYMYKQGIKGVDFVICNTDIQALRSSDVPCKIQIGTKLTGGLGAGSIPEVGKKAAEESLDEIMKFLRGTTNMVFITAGMGGGTGTGAAPVIAEACRKEGILTVAIVTLPFSFEGKKRMEQAKAGIEELKKHVDTLIIICNDKLREIYGNLSLTSAFAQADNVLLTSARGIAEIITKNGYINVDFNDIKTIMTNGGTAIMGYALASGQERAKEVIEKALNSPLLLDNKIKGANQVLIVVSSSTSNEISMDEVAEICDYVQEEAGLDANVILGAAFDDSLGDNISVVVIATGFEAFSDLSIVPKNIVEEKKKESIKKVYSLDDEENKKEEKLNTTKNDLLDIKVVVKNEVPVENPSTIPMSSPTIKNQEQENVTPDNQKDKDFITNNNKITTQEKALPKEAPKNSSTTVSVIENNEYQKQINQEKLHKDRISKLKELSTKLKNPPLSQATIQELENQPAYERKKIILENTPFSDESQVSRYTLDDNPDTQLKQNNSFLHDNVD